jgi:D-3-phosphoglycerate dehydrogenase
VVGLHGCGHIGREVVRLLQPFGCRILAHDWADRSAFHAEHGVRAVDFATLLAQSEVLSIHVPLTSATRGLYGADTLAALRPDCILINTARGELVDEAALFAALTSGRLEAACSDVLCSEPAFDSPLIALPNFLLTPHIGGSAAEARLAMGRVAIEGIFDNAVPVRGVPPFVGPEG